MFPKATAAEICQSGYAKRVRQVLPSTREGVYAAYGVSAHRAGQYEIDHLVALELGGNNTRANLWPQNAPGYGEKDKVENALHAAVCSGRRSLPAAQAQIARDWRLAGRQIPAATGVPTPTTAHRDPRPPSAGSPAGGLTFCATHRCIANFEYGRGSLVRCADGQYSRSGGLAGACNRHGGVS